MAEGCCGRLLGGKTFRDERLIRGRVHDSGRRYVSFFPNPGEQPGLRCRPNPIEPPWYVTRMPGGVGVAPCKRMEFSRL
jgi:hypothetical protein